MDNQHWPFGGDALSGENPFGGEGSNNLSWMPSDFSFETQGIQRVFNRNRILFLPGLTVYMGTALQQVQLLVSCFPLN